jgi:hypothetical protein
MIDVDGIRLEVVRMDGHRIVELALIPPANPGPPESGEG